MCDDEESRNKDKAERASSLRHDLQQRRCVARDNRPKGTEAGDDPHNLIPRYVETQRHSFRTALSELRAGYKYGCWMWFVFPTPPYIVDGVELGSSMNRKFALRTDEAGVAYLRLPPVHGVSLRDNYVASLCAVEEQLASGNDLINVFGPMDDVKALSSFALFERLSRLGKDDELNALCKRVLLLCEKGRPTKKGNNLKLFFKGGKKKVDGSFE